MSRWMIAALATSLALGGCGDTGTGNSSAEATTKRQPGSWTSKIQILRFEGADAPPEAKTQMQQMFDMMAGMSVCITPEAAAKEDISKNIEDAVGRKDCTFDKKVLSGEKVEFSGTCLGADKEKIRISAKGTNAATTQDIVMTIEPLDASGAPKGVMEMQVTSKRNGECKPGEMNAAPATAPAAAPAPAPAPATAPATAPAK